jgi:integrase
VNKNGFNGAAWKSALQKASVPAGRENGCHALRHYYASVLLHGRSDIKALSEYLGHHSAAFTLATYTHLMPAAADRARQAIDAARAGTADGPVTAQEGQI